MALPVRRSWLLVPVSDDELLGEAQSYGADVILLDLMELVPEVRKPEARLRVRDALGALVGGPAELFVQVDPELLYADIGASVWPGLTGVVVGRVETPDAIVDADNLLDELEGRRGILPGTLEIVASVETAAGNRAAFEVARASARVSALTLGRADLIMDLRPEPSGELHLMPYLMQRLVTIANAAGVSSLGAWWRHPARGLLAPPEDTHLAALRGRSIGFKGSMCLSAHQVEPLNRGFTPEESEVAEATRLDHVYTEAEREGRGAALVDGRIIDAAVGGQARSLLAYASACGAKDKARATGYEDPEGLSHDAM